jgi:hypothetical protein
MKVGFFGGLILLGLTIVFSMIAIQNNKIAREITIKNFGLNQQARVKKEDINDTNKTQASVTLKLQVQQKSDFDREFEEFDKKFENF